MPWSLPVKMRRKAGASGRGEVAELDSRAPLPRFALGVQQPLAGGEAAGLD